MLTIWAVVSLLVAIAGTTLVVAIISSRRTRHSAFDLYLAALAVPDLFLGWNCFIACTIRTGDGAYEAHGALCLWQGVFTSFGVAASFWINAIVAHDLYALLLKTKQCENYSPPTPAVVLCRCICAYAFSALVSSVPLFQGFPVDIYMLRGLICTPVDTDLTSTVLYWLGLTPFITGIPMMYTCGVILVCWHRELVPNFPRLRFAHHSSAKETPQDLLASGTTGDAQERRARRARAVSLYFFRLFLALIGMQTPGLLLLLCLPIRSPWAFWVGGTMIHLQGLMSVAMGMAKPSVWQAVRDLLGCNHLRAKHANTVAPAPGIILPAKGRNSNPSPIPARLSS